MSFSVSFSGVSPALYNVTVKAINSENHTLYLLLNAILPLIASIASLLPILRQCPPQVADQEIDSQEYAVFICHTILAAFTGLYLLILNSVSYSTTTAQILLAGTIFLLVLPAITPETICAQEWTSQPILPRSYHYQELSSRSIDDDNLEIHKQLTRDITASTKISRSNSCSPRDIKKCRYYNNNNLDIHKQITRDKAANTKISRENSYSPRDKKMYWYHNNDNLEIHKQLTRDTTANSKISKENSYSPRDKKISRYHNNDNLEIHKQRKRDETTNTKYSALNLYSSRDQEQRWYHNDSLKDHSVILGEEHSASALISSLDFWLYYIAYFCGGTIGLAYSNNLGQVSQSLGYGSDVTKLVAVYSACAFFGRLLSSTPDFLRQ